jgi:DNA-directed RNA polymerase subunit K/omega
MSEYNNKITELSDEDLEKQIKDDDEELSLSNSVENSDDEDEDEIDEDEADEDEDEVDEDDVDENDVDEDEVDEDDKTIKKNIDDNFNKQIIQENSSIDSDEDISDGEMEAEFKKIDPDLKQDYLLKYHQESKIHNFDEILSLCRIIKNKKNVIVDELHKTIPILTKYEKTRILGERTKQINNGSKPYVDIQNDIIDGYLVAQKELEEKKIPFIIRRPLPSGGSEYWHLKDLEVI